jgi:hypothetical protein
MDSSENPSRENPISLKNPKSLKDHPLFGQQYDGSRERKILPPREYQEEKRGEPVTKGGRRRKSKRRKSRRRKSKRRSYRRR